MRLFCTLTFIAAKAVLLANPQGVEAIIGEVQCFSPNSHTLEVTTGRQAILEWQTFSIGELETTRFIMPDSNSSVLNRVTGGFSSEILGTLESNGQVYLINPKGVLVGDGAIVNTASFIASSFDILNENFLQGNGHFCQGIDGSVINLGSITAANGIVRLIGNEVKHGGNITALKTEERDGRTFLVGGTVHLLGNKVALDDNAYVNASGADGGGVVLIGGDYQGANPEIFNALTVNIHENARIEADALLDGNGGRVIVWANSNSFYGNICVRGGEVGGHGGFVEVSAKGILGYHGLTNTLAPHGTRGTLLLDPSTITISADPTSSNIDFDGACGMDTYCSTDDMDAILNNDSLSNQLNFSDVIVYSTGDVNILASIYGSLGLTITAGGSINISGGSVVGEYVQISTESLSLNAAGDVNIQGGSNTLTYVNLNAGTVDITGETISITGGDGLIGFVNISAYNGAMTLVATNDITLQGSDIAIVSEVVVKTTSGPLSVTSNLGSINVNAGSQLASGASLISASDLNITADLQLGVTSSSSSNAVISGNGIAVITATDVNMAGNGFSHPATIKNRNGDFTFNVNDLNLNNDANLTLASGLLGDLILNATGDMLVANNSTINNQRFSGMTSIEVDGTVTLQGISGNANILNSTADFSLTAHTDLIMTATSSGSASINSSSLTTMILVDDNIMLTGDSASAHAASIITQDGSLNMESGGFTSLSNYSLVEVFSSGGSLTLTTGGDLTVSDNVTLAQFGSGSLTFTVEGQATFEGGMNGAVVIVSPSSIDVAVTGDLIMQAVSSGGVSVNASGDVTATGSSINIMGFDPTNIVSITSNLGNMSFTATTDFNFSDSAQLILADDTGMEMSTMTLTADQGNFSIAGSSIYQFAGDLTVIAGDNITFDSAAVMSSIGNVVFIADNNFPASPDIGTGSFVYPDGAILTAGSGKTMRIYTATQADNTLGTSADINGLIYTASPEFTDTNQEFWGFYYPDVPAPTPAAPAPDGSDFYTIYYKNTP
ncbi:MAG: filamentous hemagglutinin N-terminal domain-containing protein [Chlamydiota bacterium]